MVITGFYKDVNRICVNNPSQGGNPYKGLAAAIVLQAIRDWEWCCGRCAKGKPFAEADCNFYELEQFFREIAPTLVDGVIDADLMLETLLEHKAAAFRTRERKGISYYGADLRKDRESLGLSRRELGELTGYSVNQIERWESGNFLPLPKQQARIAEALRKLR